MPRPLSTTVIELSGCTVTGDLGAEAGKGLVDGVVHHLPHQMVQAGGARGADVHAGTLAHGLEALEDLDARFAPYSSFLLLAATGIPFAARPRRGFATRRQAYAT
jgi:hypothetical protein